MEQRAGTEGPSPCRDTAFLESQFSDKPRRGLCHGLIPAKPGEVGGSSTPHPKRPAWSGVSMVAKSPSPDPLHPGTNPGVATCMLGDLGPQLPHL